MDFTLYCFMFPVSIGVATCAMLSSIGTLFVFLAVAMMTVALGKFGIL